MSTDLSSDGADKAAKEMTVATPVNPKGYGDDALAEMKSFEDVLATLPADFAEFGTDFSDYGTGFEVLDRKDPLVGVPFGIVEWRFNQGDKGEFVSAAIITEDGRKLVINDGSTGVRDQLHEVTNKRAAHGVPEEARQRILKCRKGLRVSRYEYTDDKGNTSQAQTFYLA